MPLPVHFADIRDNYIRGPTAPLKILLQYDRILMLHCNLSVMHSEEISLGSQFLQGLVYIIAFLYNNDTVMLKTATYILPGWCEGLQSHHGHKPRGVLMYIWLK